MRCQWAILRRAQASAQLGEQLNRPGQRSVAVALLEVTVDAVTLALFEASSASFDMGHQSAVRFH